MTTSWWQHNDRTTVTRDGGFLHGLACRSAVACCSTVGTESIAPCTRTPTYGRGRPMAYRHEATVFRILLGNAAGASLSTLTWASAPYVHSIDTCGGCGGQQHHCLHHGCSDGDFVI